MRTKYTITKGYKVFRGDAVGGPIDEPNEMQLFGWLRSRGLSEVDANTVIQRVDHVVEIENGFPNA